MHYSKMVTLLASFVGIQEKTFFVLLHISLTREQKQTGSFKLAELTALVLILDFI